MMDSNSRHDVQNCVVTNTEPALLAKVLQTLPSFRSITKLNNCKLMVQSVTKVSKTLEAVE